MSGDGGNEQRQSGEGGEGGKYPRGGLVTPSMSIPRLHDRPYYEYNHRTNERTNERTPSPFLVQRGGGGGEERRGESHIMKSEKAN